MSQLENAHSEGLKAYLKSFPIMCWVPKSVDYHLHCLIEEPLGNQPNATGPIFMISQNKKRVGKCRLKLYYLDGSFTFTKITKHE